MLKKAIISISVFILISGSIFVITCAQRKEKLVHETDILGQEAICPVMGNQFEITKYTPVIEYQGTKYYFCCAGCDKDFAEDPGKYIKTMGESPQSEKHEENEKRKVLHWTCSMHPEVTADEDGNCPICNMGLMPVYEKNGPGESLHLNDRAMFLAGIKMTPAVKNQLYNKIQAIGKVAYDPGLVVAQEEYLNAVEMMESLKGSDDITVERTKSVVEKSRYKLRLLGMDNVEIERLKKTKQIDRSLIMPERETWIYAELYESDIAWVKKGQKVTVTSPAYPDKELHGKIRSINPILNDKTRSVQIRICLANVHLFLKPAMYVDVVIKSVYGSQTMQKNGGIITVPKTAVLDTGNRKIAWVYLGDGRFEPRQLKIGPVGIVQKADINVRSYPILHGIEENEIVVTNGNFLIDSESQISGIAALEYGGAIGIEETHETPGSEHEQ